MNSHSRSGKKGGRFAVGMIVYAVVVLAVVFLAVRGISSRKAEEAAASLPVPTMNIEALPTETVHPEDIMDAYMGGLTDEYVRSLAVRFSAFVDPNIQDDAAKADFIANLFAQGVVYKKYSAVSTDELRVFVVCAGDQAVGNVTVGKSGDEWALVSEDYDFSAYARSSEITVPSDCTVYCCGKALGSEYITGTLEYALLDGLYESYPSLPHLDIYRTGLYLGEEDIYALGPDGQQTDTDNLPGEDSLIINCSAEEQQALDEFAREYLACYVKYVSGGSRNSGSKYNELKRYLVEGSDLQKRFSDSIEGQEYAASRGDEITSLSVNSIVKLMSDHYLCDASFTTRSISRSGGNVQLDVNTKLLISRTDSGYLIAEMLIY